MSKLLVIKDEEEFRKRLNLATIQSVCVVADVMSLLKDYEEDVIEFEALVYRGGTSDVVRLTIPANVRAELIAGERTQVFVLKPKKPEEPDVY